MFPLTVVAIALIATGPLVGDRLPTGHDVMEHSIRTAEYSLALSSGLWWPQWSTILWHG